MRVLECYKTYHQTINWHLGADGQGTLIQWAGQMPSPKRMKFRKSSKQLLTLIFGNFFCKFVSISCSKKPYLRVQNLQHRFLDWKWTPPPLFENIPKISHKVSPFVKFFHKWIVFFISYIASTLLYADAFSNASSNVSPERTHIRTGCICKVSLRYEFSNVSSKCLL